MGDTGSWLAPPRVPTPRKDREMSHDLLELNSEQEATRQSGRALHAMRDHTAAGVSTSPRRRALIALFGAAALSSAISVNAGAQTGRTAGPAIPKAPTSAAPAIPVTTRAAAPVTTKKITVSPSPAATVRKASVTKTTKKASSTKSASRSRSSSGSSGSSSSRSGLGQGSRGAAVLALQTQLQALKYDITEPDGAFGDQTYHAVMAFQKVNGLPRTGRANAATLAALESAADPQPLIPTGGADRIEIDLAKQYLALYKGGALTKLLSVSSGNGKKFCVFDPETKKTECDEAVTPGGSFRITRRITGWRESKLGLLYNPLYFNGGIAIHGAPSVPATPASHGCVRIPMISAEWFPAEVADGTPVYVFGGKERVPPLNAKAPADATSSPTTTPASLPSIGGATLPTTPGATLPTTPGATLPSTASTLATVPSTVATTTTLAPTTTGLARLLTSVPTLAPAPTLSPFPTTAPVLVTPVVTSNTTVTTSGATVGTSLVLGGTTTTLPVSTSLVLGGTTTTLPVSTSLVLGTTTTRP